MNDQPVLRVGAPVWSLPGWAGTVTPSKGKRSDELLWYSTWCNAVEGNTTFYAVPSASSVAQWAEMAPSEFRFCFKLPKSITHQRRLRNAASELSEFLTRMVPLHENFGPIWIQLPASFGPDDLGVLQRFLSQLPQEFDWAVELRHMAFEAEGPSERAANDLLFAANVDRVIFDSRCVFSGPCETDEEKDAWEKKPRLRVRPVALSQRPTVRFIGQTAPDANEEFWRPWVPKVAEWISEGREPYVFIHTPDNVRAPDLARQFHRQVSEAVDSLAPLPEPKDPTIQAPLFP